MTNEEYKLKVQWDLDGAVYGAYENGIKAGRLAVENGNAPSRPPETLAERLQIKKELQKS